MKRISIIFFSSLSIFIFSISLNTLFPHMNLLLTLIMTLVLLYLSKSIFELCLSIYKVVKIRLANESLVSFSVFPFTIYKQNSKRKVILSHYLNMRNRTYGNHYQVPISSSLIYVTTITTMALLLFAIFNKSASISAILSLLLYNLITFINFDLYEFDRFDPYCYLLFINRADEKANEIASLILASLSSDTLNTKDLVFLTYFSLSKQNNPVLQMDLINNLNHYMVDESDLILHIHYLEFLFAQALIFANTKSSNLNDLRILIINYIDYSNDCYLSSNGFVLVGRHKDNYISILDGNFEKIELQSIYKSFVA